MPEDTQDALAPASTERRDAKLVQIQGKSFVTDLLWDTLSDAQGAKKVVGDYAKENGYDLVTMYESPAGPMVGYGSAPLGKAKRYRGAYSLAAVLAYEINLSNWLGVFLLETGAYALVAVADGQIVPGCDEVGDQDTIQELLKSHGHYAVWDRVYISDDALADLSGCDPSRLDKTSIDDLLSAKKWDAKLKVTAPGGGAGFRKLLVLMTISVVLAGGVGWWWYSGVRQAQQVAQDRLRTENARKAQAAKDRNKAQALVESRRIKPDWPTQPTALQVLDACERGFHSFRLVLAGWRQSALNCSGGRVEAQYVRPDGAIMRDFDEAANALIAAKLISGKTVGPDKSSLWLTLPQLPARGDESLPVFSAWSMSWISYFQGLPLTAKPTLALVPHPAPPKPENNLIRLLGKNAEPPPPWWNTYKWTLSVDRMPIFTILRPLMGPGVVVRDVRVVLGVDGKWSWTAEGELDAVVK